MRPIVAVGKEERKDIGSAGFLIRWSPEARGTFGVEKKVSPINPLDSFYCHVR